MRYRVTHITEYHYTEPVAVCYNQVHLRPRNLPYQVCEDYRLIVTPATSDRSERSDFFGNPVEYFSILDAHLGLCVTAVSQVDVRPRVSPAASLTLPWNRLAAMLQEDRRPHLLSAAQFKYDSAYAHRAPLFAAYAAESFTAERPVLSAAVDLMHRIHRDFRYDPKATTLHTTVRESFEQRAGVCQDFAHVLIACLRSLGLAARYVSGYLRTEPPAGVPRLIGADASHAWGAVYCGEHGWVDLDPTNDVIPNTDHITVAWGRDYGDVCPIQGVATGGGQHRMTVSVDVSPWD